jgi:WD40 repeat protein
MALTSNEDVLYFISENNQLMKVNISLDGSETQEDKPVFEYVISQFHNGPIYGMDVCLRKQIIATCGKDKVIRIWHYPTKTLELTFTSQEEANAIALHPSGFHLVVALMDKIQMMNITSKELKTYKNIPVKQCKEISFSHGG